MSTEQPKTHSDIIWDIMIGMTGIAVNLAGLVELGGNLKSVPGGPDNMREGMAYLSRSLYDLADRLQDVQEEMTRDNPTV